MWVGWVSSVHAQGPYKHLTPDNPDFERKVQVQCFLLFVFFFFFFFSHVSPARSLSSKAPSAGKASVSAAKGTRRQVLPFPLPSAPSFPLSSGSRTSPPSLLHHGADRRVRQVELARDVSGWVLLQRWRDMGGKEEGRHITGCHSWQEKHLEGSSCC